VVDVQHDLDKNRNGRYQLSNLIIGNSIEVISRVEVCLPLPKQQTLCLDHLERSPPASVSPTGDAKVTSGSFAQLEEFPLNPEAG